MNLFFHHRGYLYVRHSVLMSVAGYDVVDSSDCPVYTGVGGGILNL